MSLKRILTSLLKDYLKFLSIYIIICFIKRLIEFIFKEVSIMDYYKVTNENYVVLVTPIKKVAQDIVKKYDSLDLKIEVIKGDIYLLRNL